MSRSRLKMVSLLRRSFAGVLVWASILGLGLAQPRHQATELFNRANALYLEDNFQEAIRLYEQIRSQGWESGELFFNLGNAYYRQGKIGAAILNYERARVLLSGDADVDRNLELANLKVLDKIEPLPEFLPRRWAKSFLGLLPLGSWLWLALVLYWGTALLLTAWIVLDGTWLKRWLGRVTVGVASATLLAWLLFAGSAWLLGSEEPAIIMVSEVPARSAPGAGANEVFRLHEGTRVRTGTRSSEWTEIILADGKVGWVPSDSLEII